MLDVLADRPLGLAKKLGQLLLVQPKGFGLQHHVNARGAVFALVDEELLLDCHICSTVGIRSGISRWGPLGKRCEQTELSTLKRGHQHFPVILGSPVERQLTLFLATPAHAQRSQEQGLLRGLNAQAFVKAVGRDTIAM